MNTFKKRWPSYLMLFRNFGFRKKSRFREPLHKQHGKWDQTVLLSEWHHLYLLYWSLWRQLSRKKPLFVTRKISRLFFNTLTAGLKYCLLNRDNLTQPNQMQLSLKRKTFFSLFFWILTCRLSFGNFQKKMWPS